MNHAYAWTSSVLEHVEKAVKVYAKSQGVKIRDFRGNSLETLGKASTPKLTEGITYLPSATTSSVDGQLLRLKRSSPENYKLVVSGKMSVRDAVRSAKIQRPDNASSAIKLERSFLPWLKRQ